jgi:hypothetical protein
MPVVELIGDAVQENGRICTEAVGVPSCRVGACVVTAGNGNKTLHQATDMTAAGCAELGGEFKEFRGEPLVGGHCGVGAEKVFESRDDYGGAAPPKSPQALRELPTRYVWRMPVGERRSVCSGIKPGQPFVCGLSKELRIARPIDEHEGGLTILASSGSADSLFQEALAAPRILSTYMFAKVTLDSRLGRLTKPLSYDGGSEIGKLVSANADRWVARFAR